ncbi:hypothetical protein tb265_39510 [Gemmatimonadetes bacterium T265]|nr:hypothetical protein tb265_39510 [Gemmatimonadetes bacterium T265]
MAARLHAAVGGRLAIAVAHLAPATVVRWGREGSEFEAEPVGRLAGVHVLAVAGVGAPDAFAEQLRAAGAEVTLARYPDHHAYDARDVTALADQARSVDRVVTTLKDAVKLGPRWPVRARALWYVTQRVTLEAGASAVVDVLEAVAAAARTGAPRASHRTVPESAARGRHA